MQTAAFASLIVLALVLVLACLIIGNTWIGLALLTVLAMFVYNHLNVIRGWHHVRLWFYHRKLSMIHRTIHRTREKAEEALFDRDYEQHAAEYVFLEQLQRDRRVCIAKIQRLDFELASR